MDKKSFVLSDGNFPIPAVLWGKPGKKLLIAVHGNLSNKEDTVIALMADKAVEKGYQALSFDLPQHGRRKSQAYACTPWNCVSDLKTVFRYAGSVSTGIRLFACSMGAYFSLLAYHDLNIGQALFLSPVVNMERIILNMMAGFGVSEERLKSEKRIPLPVGETLDWDYYTYVRENPVRFAWNAPTDILYGSDDHLTGWDEISDFSKRYAAGVRVMAHGEHFFHTPEQLKALGQWADDVLQPAK